VSERADLYAAHRLADQLDYYDRTAREYERAARQSAKLTAALLAAGGIAAFLSSTHLAGQWGGWAIIAAVAPVLATALAGYEGLYGYERNAKLYADAVAGLTKLNETGAPSLAELAVEAEGVMRREQSQWGQLALEAEPER
jgi:SMODS and SLOG-associating 2TM effector domain 1